MEFERVDTTGLVCAVNMLIGAGISRVGKLGASVAQLATEALDAALRDAGGLSRAELNGFV